MVTKYAGEKSYCTKLLLDYNPNGIAKLGGFLFGHAFQAWTIHQKIILRLPYDIIIKVMEEMFGESVSTATIVTAIGHFSELYAETERFSVQRILESPFVHADETRLNIQGVDHYVWVFTDGTHVVLRMTETREASIVHEFLKGYKGVLISDFYAGYDSVPCPQQKCLVHLIRDLNEALWENPFNHELESFVFDTRNLLVPIFEAVDKYGLKKRNLNKFDSAVERFYNKTILDRAYESEIIRTFQKRFLRYRESLFRFLTQDNLPWNNNMAERAIRELAVQRKISGTFYKRVAPQYLLLLGIAQSCRFQEKSFLKFLVSKEKDIDAFRATKRKKFSTRVTSTKKSSQIGLAFASSATASEPPKAVATLPSDADETI